MTTRSVVSACAVFAAAFALACSGRPAPVPAAGSGPRVVQPGLPGEATRAVEDAAAARGAAAPYTPADVGFVQAMITHHAQALVMSELVPARTTSEELLLLARRITVAQQDEIELMLDWLRQRGQRVPEPARSAPGEHAHGFGMLSDQELAQLAAATGTEFERLFLQFMIRHHEGALEMVTALFRSPGSAQQTDLFRLASEVDSDQRIEIMRMRALLDTRGRN